MDTSTSVDASTVHLRGFTLAPGNLSVLEISLRFVNVLSAAIVAGGQLTVLLVIVPVLGTFDTRLSVQVHRAMLGHQIDRFMKPLGITSLLSALVIVALGLLEAIRIPAASLALTCVGIAGTIGVIVTSRYFNVPTNRVIAEWSLSDIPEDYDRIRRRWDSVHRARASAGLLAATAYLLAGYAR